jgi:hypothetical protein|tara:strand:- start:107 stop:493 length:387 start_codon:yes stop_codon:yes gene_type:complete
MTTYSICTGDVCVGDEIIFTETVFAGSHRKPRYAGERTIEAIVVRDSYGAAKQQHTFSLDVVASSGYQPIPAGKAIRRKGRNVYRNGCCRKPWADSTARRASLDDKHDRGAAARNARETRRELDGFPC